MDRSQRRCSNFILGLSVGLLSLAAACGDGDIEATGDGTSDSSVTTAVSSTGSLSMTPTTDTTTDTTAVPEQTTASVDTTAVPEQTTASVDTTASTASGGDRLTGRILDTRWVDDGITQIYLIDEVPIGLTSGTRLPLAREGDEVSLELGFADWSGIGGNRGSFGEAWDGEILLLEVAGRRGPWERYLVRDHERVSIPAATGFTAAMCFENGVPRAVEVHFSQDGPVIVRAWEVDLDTLSLESVPPENLSCPDLQARPVGPGSVGAVATPSGYRPNIDEDCGDMIDISGAMPVELAQRAIGGCLIDLGVSGNIGDDVALSVVGDLQPGPGTGWLQLRSFLGWDFSGAPLWRIVDAQSLSDLDSISFECWTTDGIPAVATVEGPITEPTPTEAWSIDRERLVLVSVDPAAVSCDYIGD